MNQTRQLSSIGTRRVFDIAADLDRLCHFGCLNFYFSLGSWTDPVYASISHIQSQGLWHYANIDFLKNFSTTQLNPILNALRFLIKYKFASATYKKLKLHIGSSLNVTFYRIRVYAIPCDVQGFRFIREWRAAFPKSLKLESEAKKMWSILIYWLDFSPECWDTTDLRLSKGELLKRGVCLNPVYTNSVGSIDPTGIAVHFERCKSNLPYIPDIKLEQNGSLNTHLDDIYSKIDSPELKIAEDYKNLKDHLVQNSKINKSLASIINENSEIQGIKTCLYSFQLRSLYMMYRLENESRNAIIPCLYEIVSPHKGVKFYIDVRDFKFYNQPEIYTLPKGGILAENMGLGKTLICLGLICLTKFDSSSKPDNSFLYCTDDHTHMKAFSRIRTLREICQEEISMKSLPWRYYVKDIPRNIANGLQSNPGYFKVPNPSHKHLQINSSTEHRRSRQEMKMRIQDDCNCINLYLCTGTLIIVPDNLVHQWSNEIRKHVEENFLKCLFLTKHFSSTHSSENITISDNIPNDPMGLIQYDVVIISNSMLAGSISSSNNFFPENAIGRLYWKRLILDEGHTTSSKNSRISLFCKNIFSERRWAITGTPTSGLTRLHMEEDSEKMQGNKGIMENQYDIQAKYNEKEDLVKLGNIISRFLKIEPFSSQPKLWSQFFILPISSSGLGYSSGLVTLLNSIIVRHSFKRIGEELSLPKLHHQAVFLEPSYHNKLAINLFTAVLAVNAVSSERTDVDYMFHPSNRSQLRRLVTNLQRATFHWSGFAEDDVVTLIKICEHCLKKKSADSKPYYVSSDISLLKKSLVAAKACLNNERWRIISSLHEMIYFIEGLPKQMVDDFSLERLRDAPSERNAEIGMFCAPQMSYIQRFYYKNRFTNFNTLRDFESISSQEAGSFWKQYWRENKKKNFEKFGSSEVQNASNFTKALSQSQKSIRETLIKKTDGIAHEDNLNSNKFHELGSAYTLHPFKLARILGTASSKLSYLASKLIGNQFNRVKSIVFYEFEDNAYYLSELLDILGVNYILYSTFIKSAQRTVNLNEFTYQDVSEKGGVCLIMDLKLASHGLTIISATKVYFINPVWSRSIEAQAIKRAHRIGQINDVSVETLILSGTLEEEIYNRRLRRKNKEMEEESKNKYLIDDTGMQDFILKHNFLSIDPNEKEFVTFSSPCDGVNTKADHQNELSSNNDSLPIHSRSAANDNSSSHPEWYLYLFNLLNLETTTNAANRKMRESKASDELLDDFMGKHDNMQHKRRVEYRGSTQNSKRVRF